MRDIEQAVNFELDEATEHHTLVAKPEKRQSWRKLIAISAATGALLVTAACDNEDGDYTAPATPAVSGLELDAANRFLASETNDSDLVDMKDLDAEDVIFQHGVILNIKYDKTNWFATILQKGTEQNDVVAVRYSDSDINTVEDFASTFSVGDYVVFADQKDEDPEKLSWSEIKTLDISPEVAETAYRGRPNGQLISEELLDSARAYLAEHSAEDASTDIDSIDGDDVTDRFGIVLRTRHAVTDYDERWSATILRSDGTIRTVTSAAMGRWFNLQIDAGDLVVYADQSGEDPETVSQDELKVVQKLAVTTD